MRTTSFLVTFDETLGVFLKDYSKRHRRYILCFRVPTFFLVRLLRRLSAISADDAACYRTFLRGKIRFAIVIPLRVRSRANEVVRESQPCSAVDISLWHNGRLLIRH